MIADVALFLSAVLIGLMGSGHCLGMCGGIASAHSFNLDNQPRGTKAESGTETGIKSTATSSATIATTATDTGRNGLIGPLLVFNCGRLTSYTIIGFLAGGIGAALALNMTTLIVLRSMAGILLIMMGLYVGQWWAGLVHIEKLGSRLWQKLSPLSERLRHRPGKSSGFLLGMIWGWLPCGLVYSSLAWAMSSASPNMAALLMFGFGLGTLPSMLAAGLFAYHLRRWLSRLSVRRIFAVGLIIFGLWSLPVSWSKLVTGQPDHGALHSQLTSPDTNHSAH
ncbi:sulfite exporter TauE/SafE family protein [Hahella ganghwensis]|uniref:sulfite exporter TauE/SafE family protein n=1 Tax=Hahella ganghwensis TaxID=286420 RepID=UPI00038100A5|nr:sulfite exporter TauE/SafE family protein [Hahella ganghwensis]